MNRRIPAVLIATLTMLLAVAHADAETTDIRAEPFALSLVHIPKSDFAEPSIALTPPGTVLICGPMGIPGGRNGMLRSEDGQTFERSEIFDRGGGGDCDVKVGPDGAVYTANLQAAASAIRKSVDDGRTFTYQSSEDPIEQDRQWLATDPADGSIVYLGYHDWTIGAIVLAKSLDGAKTWVIHSIASTDPAIAVTAGRGTVPGPVRVDPTNHNRVYMVWSIGDVTDCAGAADPAEGCVMRNHRTIVLGRSEDGGLTWTNHVAMTAPAGSALGQLIPWMSLDESGNVYVAAAGWIRQPDGSNRNGLFMAASTDRGVTWNGPVKVNTGSGAAVFPTVVGGGNGVADLAWIESTAATTADPSGTWTLRFAQSRDATGAAPTFSEVAGPVIHTGDVCTEGLLCTLGGDRTLLDFIDMTLDDFGYVHIVATSTIGPRHIVYWRQDAGPSATSEPCAEAGPSCVAARPPVRG